MPATNPRPNSDVELAKTAPERLAADPAGMRRKFILRRMHSLSGVVPVGAFLVVHLWTNASALAGQPAFDAAVSRIHETPLLPLVEVLFIFLPLAFHAGYGVKLAFEGRPNAAAYPYARNWAYTLQRVTGIVALIFILYHLQELRLPKLLGQLRPEGFYPTLSLRLSSTIAGVPWLAIGYLIGVGASVLHFANGLTTFVMSWGISGSRASQQRLGAAFALAGVFLFALGAATTIYFATGMSPISWLGTHSSDGSEQSAVVDPAGRPASASARDTQPAAP